MVVGCVLPILDCTVVPKHPIMSYLEQSNIDSMFTEFERIYNDNSDWEEVCVKRDVRVVQKVRPSALALGADRCRILCLIVKVSSHAMCSIMQMIRTLF